MRRRTPPVVILLCLLLALGRPAAARAGEPEPTAPEPTAPEPTTSLPPAFVAGDCPFVPPWSVKVTCGRLRVAEDRTNPHSAAIDLFVAILHRSAAAEAAPTAPGTPLLVLPGGPGSGALGLRHAFYPLSLRATHDILLLDPRGSGASLPSLDCFEVDEPDEIAPDVGAAWAACAERLRAEGRDLNAYTTAQQVDDVADLARALEIDTLDIYAASYGTRVAVRVAERYPTLVRSLVLDGVLPVAVNALLEEPLNRWDVFRRVARDCAANAACRAAFPALEMRLLALIDRYNQAPLPDDLGYGSGDDILRLLTDELQRGGARLPALITALYEQDFARACALLPPHKGCFLAPWAPVAPESDSPSAVAPAAGWRTHLRDFKNPTGPDAERVTWLMQRLNATTPQALAALLDLLPPAEVESLLDGFPQPPADGFSEGAFAGVICSEEAPFYTTDDVQAIATRIPAQLGDGPVQRAADVAALCALWPVAPVSPAQKVTAVLSTPALLLAGTHDPVSPPAWAHAAAAYLEGSRIVFFPGRGHTVLNAQPEPGDGCLNILLARFYANPLDAHLPACLGRLGVEWAGLAD